MKRFLTVAAAMLALTGMGQEAMRKLEDLTNTNLVCVTDYGPQVVSLTARVTGIEGGTNDWSKAVLNLAALSNNVAGLSSRATETNELFSAWFSGLQSRTSYWDTAYSWGDWSTAGLATTQQLAATTAALAAHTNRTDNPHGVTAAQVGAITAEQDLAALRTYHYGSPDIVESPAEWFVFDGAGTITGFNWAVGRENVVIPWAIGGVPVTAIGAGAFQMMSGIVSVIAPQTVTAIGDYAFAECYSLASVSLPQAQTVGAYAFSYCITLTSVSLPQAQTVGACAFSYCNTLTSVTIPQATSIGDFAFDGCNTLTSVTIPQATSIGDFAFSYCASLTSVHMGQNAPAEAADVFASITPPPNVYVTNPQATGWGATWNGSPVVRPNLYGSNVTAQAFTLGGDTITEWPAGGGSVPYADWTGTVTPQNGTASVAYAHGNMPVLVVPNGGGTTRVTVATGTYVATSGVSRVSLSIWAGTNTIELITNEVDYATAPDIPTDSWGTILFRRVSDGRWKGVGL